MTAVAVETRYPSDNRIRFVGQKLANRMKAFGLTYGMLAEDWGLSAGTVRNAFYWPNAKAIPPADRIQAIENALELPPNTLLDQYYGDRPDPEYWAGPSEPDRMPSEKQVAVPEKPKAKQNAPQKKTAALRASTSSASAPVFTMPPAQASPLAGPLARRMDRLERAVVAMAELLAQATGADAKQIARELGIEA